MPALTSFDFAIIRIVPRVERGEFINAGVIVFCLARKFLKARVQIDHARLRALWPEFELESLVQHLEAFPNICDGAPDAGPMARLTLRERFHWLVAPRSTSIQVSPVHSGLSDSPETALNDLFERMVAQ